jgi:Flp pilus assembly protein TadG
MIQGAVIEMRESLKPVSVFPRLRKDERGSILVQFTIYLTVIMGFIGLALDGGRVFLLHNDLQDLADAAALAGAASLDGTANALTNADKAARSLSVNDPTTKKPKWWNTSSVAILPASEGIQFFDTLADLEARPPKPTNDPKSAHYIKVITGIWSVAPTFITAVGAVSDISVQASAVAKATTVNCKLLSMMLCNPYEPTDGSSTGDTSDFGCTAVGCEPAPGRMFAFNTAGNTGRIGPTGGFNPGVFNFIDPKGSTDGDPVIERYLSQQIASVCQTGGISLAQGQKTNASQIGINVRFDQPSRQSGVGVLETAAPIVIDGIATAPDCKTTVVTPPNFNPANYTATCNSTTDPTQYSCPLPYDASFLSTRGGGTHIGTGTSDPKILAALDAYWQNHHGGSWPTDLTTGLPKTRYQAYLDEVSATTSDNSLDWLTKGVEPHAPTCLPVDVSGAARRIVSIAVVDCLYWEVRGNSADIPVNTYANFFVTNPTDRQGNIYTEYVETHQINEKDSGLYRIVHLVK